MSLCESWLGLTATLLFFLESIFFLFLAIVTFKISNTRHRAVQLFFSFPKLERESGEIHTYEYHRSLNSQDHLGVHQKLGTIQLTLIDTCLPLNCSYMLKRRRKKTIS